MMRRFLSLMLVVTLLLGTGGCKSAPKRKQAPRRQVLSPTGGYLVTAETPKENAGRNIVITRPGNPSEIVRFPFPRTVDVFWAPDETAMAVIDSVAENENRILIWELPSGRPLFEIRREDTCVLDPRLPCGGAYSHVFYSNIIWLNPNTIQATVEMIGRQNPDLPPEIKAVVIASIPRE